MNVLLATIIVAASAAVAVVVMLLLRRRAPESGYFADGDRAAGVYGVLATSFSVLLAFVVFLAFTSYDDARSGADQEATDVIQQLETAQLLPQPGATQLSGELICYGRAVVFQEWPQLQSGTAPQFNPWGVPLFRTFSAIRPRTAGTAGGILEVARPDIRPRAGARRPDRGGAGRHPHAALVHPSAERWDRARVHVLLRR